MHRRACGIAVTGILAEEFGKGSVAVVELSQRVEANPPLRRCPDPHPSGRLGAGGTLEGLLPDRSLLRERARLNALGGTRGDERRERETEQCTHDALHEWNPSV